MSSSAEKLTGLASSEYTIPENPSTQELNLPIAVLVISVAVVTFSAIQLASSAAFVPFKVSITLLVLGNITGTYSIGIIKYKAKVYCQIAKTYKTINQKWEPLIALADRQYWEQEAKRGDKRGDIDSIGRSAILRTRS